MPSAIRGTRALAARIARRPSRKDARLAPRHDGRWDSTAEIAYRDVHCTTGGEEVREDDRSVEMDHRSRRSSSSSTRNVSSGAIGAGEGGAPEVTKTGAVNRPCRTVSASIASASMGLLSVLGGTISATTRSRSVTSTVSPDAARRTYSLRHLEADGTHGRTVASGNCQYQPRPCRRV